MATGGTPTKAILTFAPLQTFPRTSHKHKYFLVKGDTSQLDTPEHMHLCMHTNTIQAIYYILALHGFIYVHNDITM